MLSETLADGLESYRDRPENQGASPKEEPRARAARGAHRSVIRHVVEDRAGTALPDASDTAQDRHGLRRWPGAFLRRFERPADLAVVRKKDRFACRTVRPKMPSYFFESLDFPVSDRKMEAYYAEFEPHSASEPHKHSGAEIIYVISGQLAVNVDGEDTLLTEGDSMYFEFGFPHSYRRQGRGTCSAISLSLASVPNSQICLEFMALLR